jgi:protein involved in polysaccharide export with SLBB domain
MSRRLILAMLLLMAGPLFAQGTKPLPTAMQGSVGQPLLAPSAPQATLPQPATAPETVESAERSPAGSTPATDYLLNLGSNVFGAQLFTGSFAQEGATQFNPDYVVAVGDAIQVRLWGGYEFDSTLVVDPKGNVFLPHVGPVQLLGVRNQDIQRVVESAVAQIYRANVYSYASLAAAQPVRVFVSGFVNRPGLYNGTSMDSLLHYLDKAGGIDLERGSFLGVQVKRGDVVRAEVSLYDFLLDGRMPLVQLADGDVVFVSPRRNTLEVSGLAQNAKRFEFSSPTLTVSALEQLAKPLPQTTHVRVVRNTGSISNVEYYARDEAGAVVLANGDELIFTADRKPGTITVRVEGEHQSPQEYVLPYGARFGELISRIDYSERSDSESLQLFRLSVRERQKQMLQTALKSLETAALTARSGTSDEAALRKQEAELLLQWIDRARKIEPLGQVLIANARQRDELLLENGDVLRIPTRDGLVLVSGEVLFPNAIAFDDAFSVDDYVRGAGGYTQNADAARVVIAHRDGSFQDASDNGFFRHTGGSSEIRPGDEILVLPKIDVKSRQITKDLSQILYQLAISAKVVLDL